MNELIKKIEAIFSEMQSLTVAFIFMFATAEIFNGIYSSHFDINAIITFYGVVAVKNVAAHGINSIYNSTRGDMPSSSKPSGSDEKDV